MPITYDLGDFIETGDEGTITVSVQTGFGDAPWGDEPWGGGPVIVTVSGVETVWTDIDEP